MPCFFSSLPRLRRSLPARRAACVTFSDPPPALDFRGIGARRIGSGLFAGLCEATKQADARRVHVPVATPVSGRATGGAWGAIRRTTSSDSIKVRCTRLSSSRTLPGHSYAAIHSMLSGCSERGPMPYCRACCPMKCSASNCASPGRSRNGGISSNSTLRRKSQVVAGTHRRRVGREVAGSPRQSRVHCRSTRASRRRVDRSGLGGNAIATPGTAAAANRVHRETACLGQQQLPAPCASSAHQ